MKCFLIALSVFVPVLCAQANSLHVQFIGKTNIPGMDIEGKSQTPIRITGNKGIIPIKLLKTGMESRDEHMYQEIFKNKDIKFELLNLEECLGLKSCDAKVQLEIANSSKTIIVKV